MPSIKDGNSAGVAIISAIAGIAFTAILNFLISNYGAGAAELRDHDQAIERLKADEARDWAAISSLSTVTSKLGSLETAVETQTDVIKKLQSQVDAMDHWLRPDPTPMGHGH